ncbi:MAG: S-layer homology domain-containing protein [Eubacteriales bacterium]
MDITYVDIEGSDFVASTMDGVPALYNSTKGYYYYCSELIPRYYAEIYGLELRISDGSITVLNNSDIYFVETDTPQKADIMYGSAEAREKSYSHWGLVRAIGEGNVTIFEQNWSWNGQAGVDCVIEFPTTYYKFYTMASKSGSDLPQADITYVGLESASAWVMTYAEQACEMMDLSDVVFTDTINREQFCELALGVASCYGIEAEGETVLEQAVNLGLISITDWNTLSRQEAAVVGERLLDLIGEVPEVDGAVLERYSDAVEIADWATGSVATLTACGFLSGANGMYQPLAPMTIEQAAVFLVQICNNAVPTVTYNSQAPAAPPANLPTASMEVIKLCGNSMFLTR